MAQFTAESVAHITAECLDQFAPERVAHFAAESVAGLLRNMHISNGVVGVSQFYDLSRIVISLSTKVLPASSVKVIIESNISFAYISAFELNDKISISIETLEEISNMKINEQNKKEEFDKHQKLKDELVKLIQPIEYM
jgi:hypothetical protein